MLLGLIVLAVLSAISLAVPIAGIVLCAVSLTLQLCVIGLHLCTSGFRPFARHRAPVGGPPVFSVHVATHCEPAEVVSATLRALQDQDWPHTRYEVIVLDNNTADAALWQPVAEVCRTLGDTFRFYHRDGVEGAKAGALNIALDLTRPDATHIVVVDADYVVAPGFLSSAADALARSGADYVQFPQAYAKADTAARGVDAELAEYFLSRARPADCAEALLLTGTLSVISKHALVAVGGWSGGTTTEDAELGLRLCQQGFTGRFSPDVVGKGLLPFTLRDLEKQRYRWCSGNLRTILFHLDKLAWGRTGIELRQRLAILSQLTAWQNFTLLPGAILLAGLLTGVAPGVTLQLAAATVVVCLFDSLWRFGRRAMLDGDGWARMAMAMVSRIALAPVSAKATFDALLPTRMRFVVTDKNARRGTHGVCLATLVLTLGAVLAFPAAVAAGPLVALAVLILMLPLPAGLITDRALCNYRRLIVNPTERIAS